MDEKTWDGVSDALFRSRERLAVDDRVEALVGVILDLMMEIEALRSVAMSGATTAAEYREAYRDTALLTHNGSGPLLGSDKLLRLFYPPAKDGAGRAWRESLIMKRAGLSDSEIAAFRRDAEDAEQYT